ncbi:MAG: branched-chain amino acid ABC transporter permease [Candidatus Bathyarchaeota archaeon]|nr:MAG: branched-chain amino acid ABC transporter permease [Candidatus Bathyarchaeota archaeon]
MDITLILQLIINGLLIGGIYSLVSMGLTLIWGVMDVVNFAQGELLMISMYIAWAAFSIFGLSPYMSVLICALALFVIGLVIERSLISYVIELPMAASIYATFGLSLFLTNLMLMIAGPTAKSIPVESWVFRYAGLFISVPRFISLMISVVSAFVLYLFMKRTRIGKALRAVSQDRTVAATLGINVRRMYMIAFSIGALLAGIAGALLMTYFHVSPTVGTAFMLSAFVAVVLGGLGNFVGSFFAGLIIGVAETVGGFYTQPGLKQAVVFVIFIAVLLFMPNGLFGRSIERAKIKE